MLWELEVWKWAEQSKFKSHLKQIELETIEDVTKLWQAKESERAATFNEQLQNLGRLEKRMKEKAHDLQKWESRIVNLEEDLKIKMNQAGQSLLWKEEEIKSVKEKFRDEKIQLQNENKRLLKQVD